MEESSFQFLAYGVVLRLDPTVTVTSDQWPTDNPAGEWRPLRYSNWLLSMHTPAHMHKLPFLISLQGQRFGERARPYMVHVAKTISPTILREMALTWPEEFGATGIHRFRGDRDVYTTFLHGHYLVERWRELLLWSWIVGKIGNDDDSWGEEESARAWEELEGVDGYDLKHVYVYMRFTLEKQRIAGHLAHAGETLPTSTEYIFCRSLITCQHAYIG